MSMASSSPSIVLASSATYGWELSLPLHAATEKGIGTSKRETFIRGRAAGAFVVGRNDEVVKQGPTADAARNSVHACSAALGRSQLQACGDARERSRAREVRGPLH